MAPYRAFGTKCYDETTFHLQATRHDERLKAAKLAGIDVRVDVYGRQDEVYPHAGRSAGGGRKQTNGIGSLVNLPFVHSVRDRHGRTRHYFRRLGFKSVRLPGLPGSAEFNRAYEAAHAGGPRHGSR